MTLRCFGYSFFCVVPNILELFNMDMHHLADSDHYFPFEDVLFNVMLAFSRDPAIMANSPFSVHRPLHGYAGAAGVPDFCAVPICGVMPFRGLVSYAAALTFMFQDEVPIYFVFRAMYVFAIASILPIFFFIVTSMLNHCR